jgi:hypothetical protein
MGHYQGTQRALKLTGAAFDTVRERFTVVGKQAKAYGAGIKLQQSLRKLKATILTIKDNWKPTNRSKLA